MRVLIFDPSGNFSQREGQGTSGWAIFAEGELVEFGDIKAEQEDTVEKYWRTHARMITKNQPDIVVCESYKLQPGKAMAQSYSALETPQMIGYLRMICYEEAIRFVFQDPSTKLRVADPILERMGIIEKRGRMYYCKGIRTNDHMRDAIRHGIFFQRYGDKGGKTASNNRPV